jgi:hypothetical protein
MVAPNGEAFTEEETAQIAEAVFHGSMFVILIRRMPERMKAKIIEIIQKVSGKGEPDSPLPG